MKILPTFIERTPKDEVTLHTINKTKTGSKNIHLFASKKDLYKVGGVFFHGGHEYLIEKIANGSPYDAQQLSYGARPQAESKDEQSDE